jgi:hypothetical protein
MVLPAVYLAIGTALIFAALAMASRKGDLYATAPAAFVMLTGHLFAVGGLALAAIHALTSTP